MKARRYLARQLVLLVAVVFASFGHVGSQSTHSSINERNLVSAAAVAEVDDATFLGCYYNAQKVKLQSKTGAQIHMFELQVLSLGENVAIGKEATQSSTFHSKGSNSTFQYADYAIDGDSATFSQTDCDDPWWEVDLGELMPIKSISILNRWCEGDTDQEGCLCQLSDTTLTLLDEHDTVVISESLSNTCGMLELDIVFPSPPSCGATQLPTLSPSAWPTVDSGKSCPMAQYVKISQNATQEQIQMFEVIVLSSGINVAIGKNASQSSTYIGAGLIPKYASYSVDGDLVSFSHTDCDDNPWWIVDLGQPMPIESVTIVNRWCGDRNDSAGCLCRLSHALISLLDDRQSVVHYEWIGDTCHQHELTFAFCKESPTCLPTPNPAPFPTDIPSLTPTYSPTDPDEIICRSYPLARYVKLMQNTPNKQLQFFEVKVISSGTNVAIGQQASQKCTLLDNNWVPRLARFSIDNDMTTFSHTNCKEPWWAVDLGNARPIEYVTIHNHWCEDPSDPSGCLCELSNASLELLDDQGAVVTAFSISDTCGLAVLDFNCCLDVPTIAPSLTPSASPTMSTAPSSSASPTGDGYNSFYPTMTRLPTVSPYPSTSPSFSAKPTSNSTASSSPSASLQPTMSNAPSSKPSDSNQPTVRNAPSSSPSESLRPTTSNAPSSNPSESHQPSMNNDPSSRPSESPQPTMFPSAQPSTSSPSEAPVMSVPSAKPTNAPVSLAPVTSSAPSRSPSLSPSNGPSEHFSEFPSAVPSGQPSTSMFPSQIPSASQKPSSQPIASTFPSLTPSLSASPSLTPSTISSDTPSADPSEAPSLPPSNIPSSSSAPSLSPSLSPTLSQLPSTFPSASPSTPPSSTAPSGAPSKSPTLNPSNHPTARPSTASPSRRQTTMPSILPTSSPVTDAPTTADPSQSPSKLPSAKPTRRPSHSPSMHPSKAPLTDKPSMNPSTSPSLSPSASPMTAKPSESPSLSPSTLVPSSSPSTVTKPSSHPTLKPTSMTESPTFMDRPTMTPFSMPPFSGSTVNPTTKPSNNPTFKGRTGKSSKSQSPTHGKSSKSFAPTYFISKSSKSYSPSPTWANDGHRTKSSKSSKRESFKPTISTDFPSLSPTRTDGGQSKSSKRVSFKPTMSTALPSLSPTRTDGGQSKSSKRVSFKPTMSTDFPSLSPAWARDDHGAKSHKSSKGATHKPTVGFPSPSPTYDGVWPGSGGKSGKGSEQGHDRHGVKAG